VQILQQAMWSWASVPADTHTVLSCTAGRPPVDRSLCHHDYTTRIAQPADACLARRLTHRICCRRYAYSVESTPTCTPIHSSAAAARWPRLIALAAAQYSHSSRCYGRPIFLNFVTFSTEHGSTSDKACSRLLGSRCVHANARRRP